MRNTYQNDPHWMNARYNGLCPCGQKISKGDLIFWYPREQKALGSSCGCATMAAAEFEAAAEDEETYLSQYSELDRAEIERESYYERFGG